MRKVLLVEDEQLVRGYLRANIPWQDIGFEVIGEAEDGQEALEMIRIWKPDVVITDIIMPVMDGLELLKRSKEEGDESLFLMLTGVNDFEHAREALEYGAWNYLLKLSLTPDTLIPVLRKAQLALLDRDRKWMAPPRLDYQQVYMNLWHRIETNERSEDDERIELSWVRRYLYVVIRIDRGSALDTYAGRHTAQEDVVIHRFSTPGIMHEMAWTDDPAWLPNPSGNSLSEAPIAWGRCESWDELVLCWDTTYMDLHREWYKGGVIPESEAAFLLSPDQAAALPYSSERTLIHAFEEHKVDSFYELLEQEWNGMARKGVALYRVKESALRLYRICASEMGVTEQALGVLKNAVNHWALLAELRGMVEKLWLVRQEKTGMRTDHPQINQMIQYIHEHYAEPITLEWMADHVAMDKYYVSMLFKKKTGDSFVHYLQKLRVEKAKKLLRETNASLNEIANHVGYMEDNYLAKMFKRWVGITPSEYRKSQT
jgi:two-component system response regulator YesN